MSRRQPELKNRMIYLGGPEVFILPKARAIEIGERKKEICRRHGFKGRFPLDKAPVRAKDEEPGHFAMRIFEQCVAMMNESGLAVVNMTPFRGVSMDVGTAVEVGYMYAQGKPVFAYSNVMKSYVDRVADELPLHGADLRIEGEDVVLSEQGVQSSVENFGFHDNLMCEGPIRHSHGSVVPFEALERERFSTLDGFAMCIQQVTEVLG